MYLLMIFCVFPILYIVLTYVLCKLWNISVPPLTHIPPFLVGLLFVAIISGAGAYYQMDDVEVWNGQVLSKQHERVSCSHSYSCNCRVVTSCSGSGKDRSCTSSNECDTCYEHPYDIDWNVNTTVGQITIDRVDRQGLDEPPRWSIVKPGDPVSRTHHFINYVKAAPDSLFHNTMTHQFDNMIPAYPNNVYDYYKLDHVITVGVRVPDLKQWNDDVANMLRALGPSKQVNVIVLFVNTADENYINALNGAWIGGKKNDVIVVIGTTSYPRIDWVEVSSWTDKAIFKVQLRDDIMANGVIDRTKIVDAIGTNITKTFVRKQMKDFEYLKTEIDPPLWATILSLVMGLGVSVVWCVINRKQRYKHR